MHTGCRAWLGAKAGRFSQWKGVGQRIACAGHDYGHGAAQAMGAAQRAAAMAGAAGTGTEDRVCTRER